MATKTTQVHERYCDRCGKKCERGRPRIVIGPQGVAELTDDQSSPTALDACTACTTSAQKWWKRVRGES